MKDCLLEVGGIPCNQNPSKCARLVNWQIGDGTGNDLEQEMLYFADGQKGVLFIAGLTKPEMSRPPCLLNTQIRDTATRVKNRKYG